MILPFNAAAHLPGTANRSEPDAFFPVKVSQFTQNKPQQLPVKKKSGLLYGIKLLKAKQ
jgi:hypothetical protein